MNIQIFGTKKCNDTKKAERFFRSFWNPERSFEKGNGSTRISPSEFMMEA